MLLQATITIGRDTRDGGYAEESITVEGKVGFRDGEYEVDDVEVVDGAGLVVDLDDLSFAEFLRAQEALIAAYEAQKARAA